METLIPDSFFISVSSVWFLVLIVAVAIVALSKGADILVDSSSSIALKMGMSEVIIGATVVSLGTTTPEAAVSVLAAWTGKPDLALGNAVGSVICDTALIFGFCSLLAVIPANRFVLNRHGWLQLGSGVLLTAICFAAWAWNPFVPTLGRGVGVLLLVLLAGYLWISFRWSHGEPPSAEGKEVPGEKNTSLPKVALVWTLGLVIVLLSSRVLIGSVTELAVRWNVPRAIIAATLVAFGTSLPELVTGIAAVIKGKKDLLVGNIIGADILNVLFVIGASATAASLPIPKIFFELHLPYMVGVLVLFRIFIFMALRKGAFSRWMGIPLLGAYGAYLFLQWMS